MSDILLSLDTGNLATLLDLSAAFDSINHSVLLRRLQKLYMYSIHGAVLKWFKSYLTERRQSVRTWATNSTPSTVFYGVQQRSVLRPILFILYTADVLQLVRDYGLMPHAYAEDIQIVGICLPSETDMLQNRVSVWTLSSWMAANRLQLNHNKTEALWCLSQCRQHQIPSRPVRVSGTSVQPVTTAKNLGVYLDADATLCTHVTSTVRACFAILQEIRSVRHSLLHPALVLLICALIIRKVDYCSAVLCWLVHLQFY